jgi:hypothetical protein
VEGSSSRRVQSRQGILRRVKPKYHRRKVVWDCISALVRAGFTAQVAIDRVYQLYGKNTKFTRISNRMNETRSSSWHRASIVAGLKISIRLILILLFMDTSLHDNYNKLTREAAKGAQHHRDNYILLLFASLSSSLLVISAIVEQLLVLSRRYRLSVLVLYPTYEFSLGGFGLGSRGM